MTCVILGWKTLSKDKVSHNEQVTWRDGAQGARNLKHLFTFEN